ncbi:MAG: PDDEXK nuclease domain-containing protein [Bacteroides sp.]|nr:PDDEXK nuclease domain-containing protein [Bacteroides sp.]MCM1456685.1 PDDEXK nuclease domain-containing protein [Lachnoclostridium sp.]
MGNSDHIQKCSLDDLLSDVKVILQEARTQISRSVNTTLVTTYWQIGKYIVEYEQGGNARAEYSKGVIKYLSKHLTAEFGNGFNETNLRYMRLFFKKFPIYHSLSDKLTWTHYRTLLKVNNPEALAYYMQECSAAHWSVRQLERQIHSMYYERLLASKDKKMLKKEANTPKPGEIFNPREIIRDPYVLEFLGLSQGEHFLESDFEQQLISKIQMFLLEMGRGFTFVARQKRITMDNRHFYIDLVFYNILSRCYVLIDLKTGDLTHQDLGQMQMYVNYYTREMMNPGDNPPVGIVLCADKSDALVRYTLPEGETQIYASKYLTYLPSAEELQNLLND